MAKATEFRELSAEALHTKVKDLEAQLFNSRLQGTLGKLENTAGLRALRRDIARARTVLREKDAKAA